MSQKKWHSSLKMKLLTSTIAITFIMACVSIFLIRNGAKSAEIKTQNMLKSEAESLSYVIQAQFFERYGDVQAFAENSVLQDQSLENRDAISKKLSIYVKLYGIYDLILYVGSDGKLIAANTKSVSDVSLDLSELTNRNFADDTWFKNVINGSFTEDKTKGFVGTLFEDAHIDPYVKAVYQKDVLTTGFSAPVKDASGKVIGAITNRANFKWVEHEYAKVRRNLVSRGMDQSALHLFNKEGQLIVDFDKGESVVRELENLLKPEESHFNSLKTVRAMPNGVGVFSEAGSQIELEGAHAYVAGSKMIDSIGWEVLISEDAKLVFADVIRDRNLMLFLLSTLTLIFAISSWLFSSQISRNFMQVADRLGLTADMSHKTSLKLTSASQAVSDSSTDQSAAVQETVSSMSEISSMIAQTNTNVKECTQIASRVTSRSEQGNQTMRKLASAMDAVNHANSQLQNMANIINEVSAKTMVINDIVFKTQLLSINASIEAARAGQHGKGFAVVAEEVGNLAQMSGNAAKEIQLLISDSQKQVLQIIEVTQSRAKESQAVSQEAVQSFSEIASGILAINERLAGVTQATHEQEIGIQQISLAMTQMDQSTQRNSSLAAEANQLAVDLGKQSSMSFRLVRALRTIVAGSSALREKKKTDIVDQLLDERDPENDSGIGEQHADRGSPKGNLNSLVGQFAEKLDRNHSDSGLDEVGAGELDADDPSFKRSA